MRCEVGGQIAKLGGRGRCTRYLATLPQSVILPSNMHGAGVLRVNLNG